MYNFYTYKLHECLKDPDIFKIYDTNETLVVMEYGVYICVVFVIIIQPLMICKGFLNINKIKDPKLN